MCVCTLASRTLEEHVLLTRFFFLIPSCCLACRDERGVRRLSAYACVFFLSSPCLRVLGIFLALATFTLYFFFLVAFVVVDPCPLCFCCFCVAPSLPTRGVFRYKCRSTKEIKEGICCLRGGRLCNVLVKRRVQREGGDQTKKKCVVMVCLTCGSLMFWRLGAVIFGSSW